MEDFISLNSFLFYKRIFPNIVSSLHFISLYATCDCECLSIISISVRENSVSCFYFFYLFLLSLCIYAWVF